MGIILGMFGIGGFFALFISAVIFGAFINGIKNKLVKIVILGGIFYIIAMIITILCFLVSLSAADYGGFSKSYLIFIGIVAFGMHLTALSASLKIKWLSIPGIAAAVLPFVYLFIVFLKLTIS